MNFNELYKKIHAINEGQALPLAPTKDDGAGAGDNYNNKDMEECGMPMPLPMAIGGAMGPSHEQDHVSMNVSLNGSGAGGVRDLMDILRNIEQGAEHGSEHDEPEEPLLGDMLDRMGHEQHVGEEFENSVHGHEGPREYEVNRILRKGNDMHSKGKGALKHNGGENPMHEALVDRLSAMYQSIKEERTEEKDEKGNVVRWKEETPWRKATGKDGRGKVTNMSDKARRESEKLSKKELAEAAEKRTMSRAAKGVMKYGKDGMKALAKAGREGKSLEPVKAKYNKYDEGVLDHFNKTDDERRKQEAEDKRRQNDLKFVKNVKRRDNVPQHEKDTATRIEKRLKGEKISEWGVNLTQPNSDLFGKAPANFNDKANVNALTAKYDDLIKHTQQEIDKLKANPTGPGSDSLINTLQQQIKGLEAEKLHNMTGASNDDASNALRKQAIANNELTPGQWLQKATQYFKGKVTGKPQPGVSYDRYDTSHQAEKDWTTPTPFKPGTGLEESVSRILELNKKLNG